MVYQQSYQSVHAYTLLVEGCTRLGGLYIYLGEVNITPIKVAPISVNNVEPDVIKIRGGVHPSRDYNVKRSRSG